MNTARNTLETIGILFGVAVLAFDALLALLTLIGG